MQLRRLGILSELMYEVNVTQQLVDTKTAVPHLLTTFSLASSSEVVNIGNRVAYCNYPKMFMNTGSSR